MENGGRGLKKSYIGMTPWFLENNSCYITTDPRPKNSRVYKTTVQTMHRRLSDYNATFVRASPIYGIFQVPNPVIHAWFINEYNLCHV